MKFYAVIVTIQIVQVCSANLKISVPDRNEHLTIAAANIANVCLESSVRWSELLIISDDTSNEILEKINYQSKFSNSILSLDCTGHDELKDSRECYNHSNTKFGLSESKTTAIVISTHSAIQLESVLHFLKNDVRRTWRPRSYFLIILETGCDLEECNNMFKVIWDYWILNAVILCRSNDSVNENRFDIELYTFNPYSVDNSPKWEPIVNETIEVSISPGNFNHSWYIFKRRLTDIKSFEDCGDLFFDKTSNLDGYVIPISFAFPEFLLDTTESISAKVFVVDSRALKTLTKKLRFKVAQVLAKDLGDYGTLLENGTYSGMMDDVYNKRSHLAPTLRGLKFYPGLDMTYPYDETSACFASRIVGFRPQWTNLADAKHMWIALGCGLLFSAAFLYLQNKSNGIVSAFLDAERLIIGSSIIHTSTVIKHRIILGSIFLVVLVVDGAIRGRFISILTVVQPYPNLDTIEQLREQHVDVYGHENMKVSVIDPDVKARMNDTLNITECLDGLERGKKQQACFTSCPWLQCETSNSTVIHRASYTTSTSYVVFLTSMHWPMTDRYSSEVQKLLEAGLVRKWKLDVYREVEVNSWKVKRAAEPPYFRPAKINDMLPAFVLLFVGLSAALIIFIWELEGSKSSVMSNWKN